MADLPAHGRAGEGVEGRVRVGVVAEEVTGVADGWIFEGLAAAHWPVGRKRPRTL